MKTMKCANLYGINDLRYEDISVPNCQEDEALVAVKSCGICGSDIPRVYTKGTYHFPTVIGHEFAGVVVFDPQKKLEGKNVAVFPLLPCFSCNSCKEGNYATCENYDYYGSRRDGGMSEYVAVKRWNLLPVPKGVSDSEAAMCEPVSVARHAICKLNIKQGDSLLISGAGPIGIMAGQWAKSFGVEQVYYFDIDERKIELVKQLDFARYQEGQNINCVLEGTGYSDALMKCLAAIQPGGRMVLMGNPADNINLSQNAYWHILRKELAVYGTWNSSYNERQNDWKESLKAMADGKINVKPLITHTYPLKAVNQAFEMMKNKSKFFCKVILTMGVRMKRIKKIAPSIMCAPLLSVYSCLRELEQSGADLIHVDVMDGSFVSNYTLGTNFVKELKCKTSIPLDIHLMIDDPEKKLDWFSFGEGDYVSVHYEASRHLNKALAAIRARGAKAMVALNPATPIYALESMLDDMDAVLLMTVNPGFAGQTLVESTLNKIHRLRAYLDDAGYPNMEIEVDGNVSFENAKRMREAGADIYVAGSSSVFSKEASLAENIARLRKNIE